ncbi:hypothetical protein B6K85_25720 [Vibrio sp. V1B]|nr:hypothetical protein B6K85_25720 [Vibrio sp. V1B]
MLAARTDRAIKAAKEHGVKITWGTDVILTPEAAHLQRQFVADIANWFTPYEVLKMVIHDNGQLLAMSGLRSPYQDGKLGVIEEGRMPISCSLMATHWKTSHSWQSQLAT